MFSALAALLPLLALAQSGEGLAVSRDDRPTSVVLPLRHDDSISAARAAKLSNEVRNHLLAQTRFRVIAGDALDARLSSSEARELLMTCESKPCLQQLAKATDAAWILFGRMRRDPTMPLLEGYVYDATTDRLWRTQPVTGERAWTTQGAQQLGMQLDTAAGALARVRPPLYMNSPYMGLGAAMTAAGLIGVLASLPTVAFSYWVSINGYLDTNTQIQGRVMAIAAALSAPIAFGVAVTGVGIMGATVWLWE